MNASTLYLAQGERGREMRVALSKLLVQTLSVEYIHTHIHTYSERGERNREEGAGGRSISFPLRKHDAEAVKLPLLSSHFKPNLTENYIVSAAYRPSPPTITILGGHFIAKRFVSPIPRVPTVPYSPFAFLRHPQIE